MNVVVTNSEVVQPRLIHITTCTDFESRPKPENDETKRLKSETTGSNAFCAKLYVSSGSCKQTCWFGEKEASAESERVIVVHFCHHGSTKVKSRAGNLGTRFT